MNELPPNTQTAIVPKMQRPHMNSIFEKDPSRERFEGNGSLRASLTKVVVTYSILIISKGDFYTLFLQEIISTGLNFVLFYKNVCTTVYEEKMWPGLWKMVQEKTNFVDSRQTSLFHIMNIWVARGQCTYNK